MEYHSAIRKQILPFATTWMELEGIMLSEISLAEKDKYQMSSTIVESSMEVPQKAQNRNTI